MRYSFLIPILLQIHKNFQYVILNKGVTSKSYKNKPFPINLNHLLRKFHINSSAITYIQMFVYILCYAILWKFYILTYVEKSNSSICWSTNFQLSTIFSIFNKRFTTTTAANINNTVMDHIRSIWLFCTSKTKTKANIRAIYTHTLILTHNGKPVKLCRIKWHRRLVGQRRCVNFCFFFSIFVVAST